MTMAPFLSLPQLMILVTPMMNPLKLFGLRLPKACGEWLMSLMGSCIYKGPPAWQFHSQEFEVA